MIKVEGNRKLGKIRLYALSTCIWCRKTKAFLDKSGIEYEYVYVDELELDERDAVRAEMRRLAGRLIFPTVVLDDTVIAGHRPSELREALKLQD